MDQSAELQQRVRAAMEMLRPHPHRGDLIAAGAVPLTVAVLLVNLRLNAPWGTGIFLVLDALACALVLGMGVLAPREEDRPRAYQTVLLLCGLVLLFVGLLRLAEVLGADGPLDSAGSTFWILAVMTAAAAWLARERRSAICALVGGVTGTFAVLAFVDWAFGAGGAGTTRWILLLVALGLLAGALVLRESRRRESVYLVDAAGVAILTIAITYLATFVFGLLPFEDGGSSGAPGAGWKLILLAAGLGLVAYAGVDEEAGPGYLGALILLAFVVLVGIPGEGGPSLWFWPAMLLLAGGAMIAAGLRPREPLPPEPAVAGRPPEPASPVAGAFGGAGAAAPSPAPASRERAGSTGSGGSAPVAPAVPGSERAASESAAGGAPGAPASRERAGSTGSGGSAPVAPAVPGSERAASESAAGGAPGAPASRERAGSTGSGGSAPVAPVAPGSERAASESASGGAPGARASRERAGPTGSGGAAPAVPGSEREAPGAPPAERSREPSAGEPAPGARFEGGPVASEAPAAADAPSPSTPDDDQLTQAQLPVEPDPQPTRPQPPVVPPEEPASPPARRPTRDPEPPARGSLWARADPGEQPTRQHRAVRPEESADAGDEPADVRGPGDV